MSAIKPGIADADKFPVRADEEKLGDVILKVMFERLLLCDFAIADLTTSNPNVMYELGVRHAARSRTALAIYAASTPLPFDVNLLRPQPYRLEEDNELSESSPAGNLRINRNPRRQRGSDVDQIDNLIEQLVAASGR